MALVRSDARTASRQIRRTTQRPKASERKVAQVARPSIGPSPRNRSPATVCSAPTNKELARLFNVDVSTIEDWMRTKPEFSRPPKKRGGVADANVASSVYRKALSGDVAQKPPSRPAARQERGRGALRGKVRLRRTVRAVARGARDPQRDMRELGLPLIEPRRSPTARGNPAIAQPSTDNGAVTYAALNWAQRAARCSRQLCMTRWIT
jgi:hypothetical protein